MNAMNWVGRVVAGSVVSFCIKDLAAPYIFGNSRSFLVTAATSTLSALRVAAVGTGTLAIAAGGFVAAQHIAHKTDLKNGDGFDLMMDRNLSENTVKQLHTYGPAATFATSLLPLLYFAYTTVY